MDGAAKNGHLNVLSGYMPIEVKAAPPMDEAAMNQFWDVMVKEVNEYYGSEAHVL
ncbi:hypothetical protein F444_00575 [Phytophthora nicotianae P1976]|uniref:Uncharacterized protein n=1 Tax=Phytophthora nicotianae P1976 TaxID=1317066 RepID=A0A081B3V5_PHYNI|nr:hypothetical protein F444_00575 [Phytophthora nicotianae P1976]